MRLRILFIVGLGVGYILGARAGRPRYDKLKAKATEAWEDPRVQKIVSETQEFVKENAPIVQDKVVTGTKAAVAGAQETYVKAAETAKDVSVKVSETAKDVSGKVARTAKDVSAKVAKTAKDVSQHITDRGEEVIDGAIITAANARERALEADPDDDLK